MFGFYVTFEGNSITADGSDGIADVILSLQCRVDMYHLKVHRHTAEPENLSDMIEQLWTNSISRYEGHSVSASILCWRGNVFSSKQGLIPATCQS